jgi:hypothetical protein
MFFEYTKNDGRSMCSIHTSEALITKKKTSIELVSTPSSGKNWFFDPILQFMGSHSWWKKYVILNTVSVKNTLLFCNSVFPM